MRSEAPRFAYWRRRSKFLWTLFCAACCPAGTNVSCSMGSGSAFDHAHENAIPAHEVMIKSGPDMQGHEAGDGQSH
jgi:hypothetical protein